MVLVSKFLLHLPLNRQSEAYRREGVDTTSRRLLIGPVPQWSENLATSFHP
jgi:hypothetical protein